MRHFRSWVLLVFVSALGCGGGSGMSDSRAAKAVGDGVPGVGAPAIPVERKIISTTKMTLSVENLDIARPKLEELIKSVGGFVAMADESRNVGTYREGRWTIRVPVKSSDGFIEQVGTLGEVARKNVEAKDVTDEYVDVQARLKHWKSEEEVLLRLMKEKAQSTDDIVKFRAQLGTVRENIDRLEARMNTLSRLTEMATLELTMTERKVFTSDQAPTYSTKLGRAFESSTTSIVDFGKWIVLAVVTIAPWLPILLVGYFLLRFGIRKVFGIQPKPVVAKRVHSKTSNTQDADDK
jgi:hypothetical protein